MSRTPEELAEMMREFLSKTPKERDETRKEIISNIDAEDLVVVLRFKEAWFKANENASPADPFLYGISDHAGFSITNFAWEVMQSSILQMIPELDRETLERLFATVFAVGWEIGRRYDEED